MSKKHKPNNYFHVGTFVRKNDRVLTPLRGAPFGHLDTYVKRTGRIYRRRKYKWNGRAYVDLDVAEKHKDYDHAHDIKGNNRSKDDRPLTKREKRELNRLKKKRRYWKNDE